MKYKKYSLKDFDVYTIKTDRFKKCHIEVIFNEDMKKENIMKRCFLNRMLAYSSSNYKTKIAKNIRLEELYDSYFYTDTSKAGDTLSSTFSFDFLNPKYCDKNFLKEMLDFIFDILNKPNIKNKCFDKESFKAVKNMLEAKIKSYKENPENVAFDEAINIMDKDSSLNYLIPGSLDDLKKVTPNNLYSYYQEVYQKINCDILIIGDLDMDYVVREIEKRYKFVGDKTYQIKTSAPLKEKAKEEIVIKKDKYNQSILVMGYNCNNISFFEKQITAVLINKILSSGLEGKLPKYLREDNSLCYYVYTEPKPFNDVLMICAAVNKKDFKKASELIKKAIDEVKKGKISKEELANAKISLINYLETIDDRQNTLINDYYMTSLGFFPTIKERKEGIKNTTVKDIMKVANKLKINTTFFLEGDLKDEKN